MGPDSAVFEPSLVVPTDQHDPKPGWRVTDGFWIEAAVLVAICVSTALFTPGFLSVNNIRAVLESASVTGIVAATATIVTLSGNFFSLSTQQSAILAAILFCGLIGNGFATATSLAIVVGAVTATGVIQGAVVAAGLNPIITTLAAGSILLGSVAWATGNASVSMHSHSVAWLGTDQVAGFPVAVLVFITVTLLTEYLASATAFGRRAVLCGANPRTARLSGIPLPAVTIGAFGLASAGAAVAGILTASEIGYASTNFFGTLTFDVIAAILVGGTAIQGGYGSPLRSAYGAVLISVIRSAMLLHQFSGGEQQALEGALVVVVIVFLQSPVLRGKR